MSLQPSAIHHEGGGLTHVFNHFPKESTPLEQTLVTIECKNTNLIPTEQRRNVVALCYTNEIPLVAGRSASTNREPATGR